MATTEIHAIASTPQLALNYCISDKIEEIKSENEINKEIPHEVFEKDSKLYVRYFTLVSYHNCNVLNPYSSFQELQDKWQNVRYNNNGSKTKSGKEPLMYHLHQSFNGFEVSYEVANEIGLKLAQEVFKDFAVTVSTHGNTDNVHNHFNISAWDKNGKKWNDCHATKRLIRQVSDRLCEEYGLSVLENTRRMNLVKYKDKNGVTRYYEPTDRKNELIRQRTAGEISKDDVTSYRNTSNYQIKQQFKMDNREEIKNDIDRLLPTCRTYNELLLRLRDLGYIIRDKKQNGEWMKHISFQAPTHLKATREDKIGDGNFYLRENLERYIQEHNKEKNRTHREYENTNSSIPYFENYEYGETDISSINYNYKTVLEDDKFVILPRTEAEQKVITDIRITDNQIKGLIDTASLEKLIAEGKSGKKQRSTSLSEAQIRSLVSQIRSSFQCLQYSEKHNIYSYEQILDLYSVSKSKYNATVDNFEKAENAIAHLKDVLSTPQKLSELQNKIEANKKDLIYILENYEDDRRTLKEYKTIVSKYKIDTDEGEASLTEKVKEFESRQEINRVYMSQIINQMSELENCIRTFDRIDAAHNARNQDAMREFDKMVKPSSHSETGKTKHRKDNQNR